MTQDPNGKNFGTASWTYNVPDGAFDFLAAGETLTLTYMARVDNNYAPFNETASRHCRGNRSAARPTIRSNVRRSTPQTSRPVRRACSKSAR